MRPFLTAIILILLGTLGAYGAPSDDGWQEPQLFSMPQDAEEGGSTDIPEANTSVSTLPPAPAQRYLYTSLLRAPERLFKGEIFPITLRTIVTTEAFESLSYNIAGGRGLKLLNSDPVREYRDRTYYDRFYFKVTDGSAVLPEIIPSLTFNSGETIESAPIKGTSIDVTVLNPPKDFCGVLAERFEITHIKTTVYDKEHTIIVISADANRSDLGDFHIPSAGKQAFESLNDDPNGSSMSYYAVLPKTLETLQFRFFNLRSAQYERISIPIEIDDDLVSTISDLKPTDHGHDYQKTIIFAALATLLFLLAFWRRSWFFFVVAAASAGYAVWLSVPLRKVCISEGAPIYLLPMRNAPIFEKTPTRYELEKQGHIKNYTKVRLLNDKIGWVKDEDICTR